MAVYRSAENYLETILMIREEKGCVRSIDVARRLGFSKPSVSRAVNQLREEGYLSVGASGHLELSPSGEAIAAAIYERHVLLTRWLTGIGVSPEQAEQDACEIEHDLSDEAFSRLKEFTQAHSNLL